MFSSKQVVQKWSLIFRLGLDPHGLHLLYTLGDILEGSFFGQVILLTILHSSATKHWLWTTLFLPLLKRYGFQVPFLSITNVETYASKVMIIYYSQLLNTIINDKLNNCLFLYWELASVFTKRRSKLLSITCPPRFFFFKSSKSWDTIKPQKYSAPQIRPFSKWSFFC